MWESISLLLQNFKLKMMDEDELEELIRICDEEIANARATKIHAIRNFKLALLDIHRCDKTLTEEEIEEEIEEEVRILLATIEEEKRNGAKARYIRNKSFKST